MTAGSLPAVARAPRRADGLLLLGVLQGSGHRSPPALVRRADGQTVQVTALLHALLEELDGQRDLDALADALSSRLAREVHAEDVAFLVEERLRPLGLVQDADGAAPATRRSAPLLALHGKAVVLSPAVTDRVVAPLARLLSPLVVLPVLAGFVATVWYVLVERGLAGAVRAAVYQPGMLLTVVAVTVLASAFHELGHAAACRYGGARPGAMGVGLYLVWPAFYTDVDDSYRLSRWGRLRVDLGGLYFHCIAAVLVLGLWWATGAEALLLAVATLLLQMLRQLAPVVRADGYHLLADLTGVPDLFAHVRPVLRRLVPFGQRPAVQLRPWAQAVVTGWVLVVVPVLLGLLVLGVHLLPRLLATAQDAVALHLAALRVSGVADPLTSAATVLSLLALVLPVAALVWLLARVLRRVGGTSWRRTQGSPRGRAAVVAAGVALLLLLTASWTRDGAWDRVREGERGRLQDAAALAPVLQRDPSPLRVAVARAGALAAADPLPLAAPAVLRPPAPVPAVAGPVRPAPSGGRGLPVAGPPARPGVRPALRVAPPAPVAVAARPGRQLRFTVPGPVRGGDQQALAVGTRDGRTQTSVVSGLIELVAPGVVDNRNEAWALAACADCTTTAVSLQVVLVAGDAPVVVPVNAAVAGNSECLRCTTTAIAVQIVATVDALPQGRVRAELLRALGGLEGVRGRRGADLDPARVRAAVRAVEQAVLGVLLRSGLVRGEGVQRSDSTATSARAGTTSATRPVPAGPTGGTAPGPGAAGSTAKPTTEPADEPTEQPAAEPGQVPAAPAPVEPVPAPTAATRTASREGPVDQGGVASAGGAPQQQPVPEDAQPEDAQPEDAQPEDAQPEDAQPEGSAALEPLPQQPVTAPVSDSPTVTTA